MTPNADHAREIRHALSDPRALCETLGIIDGKSSFQRQATGLIVKCPVHGGLSCSVTRRADNTIGVRCFGCDFSGDALTLIAVTHGLDTRRDFPEVLKIGAELAGLWAIVDELRTGQATDRPAFVPPARTAEPERDYPPIAEVRALWDSGSLTTDDACTERCLEARRLAPGTVDGRELARSILDPSTCPQWASCKWGDWVTAGYRIVVPMFDALGQMRTLRAWRVTDGEGPKRLPPYGHKASGVVMADGFGRAMLAGTFRPSAVVITEGEPDYLSWATRTTGTVATLGIVTGSWSDAFAARFPIGLKVVIRTDPDPAGERYAAEITESLRRRCIVRRAA